jgi:hypothetical protein
MAENDDHRAQWNRWFVEAMENLGFSVEGDGRDRTRRNNMWTNDRREEWDTEPVQQDRSWTRSSREAASKKRDGVRQVVVGVCSAALGAIALYVLAHAGLK